MTYYDENINKIKSMSKKLYDILKEKAIFDVEVEAIENSENFLVKYNGISNFMHSFYDRKNEMKYMTQSIREEDSQIILFGIGDGLIIEYIRENFPNIKSILVVEPSLECFNKFLSIKNFEKTMLGLSVSFIVNQTAEFTGDELGKYLNQKDLRIIHHVTSFGLFNDYYNEMLKKAKEGILLRLGNYNFDRVMNKALLVNSLLNMDYGQTPIEDIAHVFEGKPMIVVAAGPSLEKNMHRLKDIRDRAIIVAVGTAMKILDSNGIKAHFRMAFDGHKNEMKVMEGIETRDTPLIYTNTLYYDCVKKYQGPKYCASVVSDYFSFYLNERLNREAKLIETGASITVSATDLGVMLGCNKIIFIGLDLALSEKQMYARGAGESREFKSDSEFRSDGYYKTTGSLGDEVYTNKPFLMHKLGVEMVIKHNKDKIFIDATEGGVKIEGAEIKTLDEVIENDLKKQYPEILDIQSKQSEDEQYMEFAENLLDEMIEDIELVQKVNRNRVNRLKKIKKNIEKKIRLKDQLKELKDMNEYIKEMNDIPLYKNYIQRSLNNIKKALKDQSRYYGFDSKTECEYLLKYELGMASELELFTEEMKLLIELKKEEKLYAQVKILEGYDE